MVVPCMKFAGDINTLKLKSKHVNKLVDSTPCQSVNDLTVDCHSIPQLC